VLERDRVWSAYALADLDPPHAAHARWLGGERAAVLTYTGFEPPVLFAAGEPDEARCLLGQIPAATCSRCEPCALEDRLRDHTDHHVANDMRPGRSIRRWRKAHNR
jgi:hypothetical protein